MFKTKTIRQSGRRSLLVVSDTAVFVCWYHWLPRPGSRLTGPKSLTVSTSVHRLTRGTGKSNSALKLYPLSWRKIGLEKEYCIWNSFLICSWKPNLASTVKLLFLLVSGCQVTLIFAKSKPCIPGVEVFINGSCVSCTCSNGFVRQNRKVGILLYQLHCTHFNEKN
jgi:hypothetical protein